MGKNAQKRRGKKHREHHEREEIARDVKRREPAAKRPPEPAERGPKWLERTVFASRADLPAPERHDLFGVALRTSFALVCGPDFNDVAREVGEAMRTDRVVIVQEGKVCGRYRAASRDGSTGVESLLTDNAYARLAQGEEILIPDVPRDETLDAPVGVRREFGAFLAVPLAGGQGVLATSRREVRAFVEEDHVLLRDLANVVARELDVAAKLRAAFTCPVTGLLSRQAALFLLERDAERASREGRSGVLFMADVDGLAALNHEHGREAADDALTRLGERLVDAARLSEWVAHLGGGTFLIFLAAGDAQAAESGARRLLEEATAQPVALSSGEIAFKLSAGAALHGVQQSGVALLKDAMAALLAAKRAAGNRLVFVGADEHADSAAPNKSTED